MAQRCGDSINSNYGWPKNPDLVPYFNQKYKLNKILTQHIVLAGTLHLEK